MTLPVRETVRRALREGGILPEGTDGQMLRSNGAGTPPTWDDVEDMAYTPGTDADWTDPNPTTIKEAIDRIAAVVATAHGAIG